MIAIGEIELDFMKVGRHADDLRARLLDLLAKAAPTDDNAGKCLSRLTVSLNAIPASVLLKIALADDLLEGRVVEQHDIGSRCALVQIAKEGHGWCGRRQHKFQGNTRVVFLERRLDRLGYRSVQLGIQRQPAFGLCGGN